MTSLTTFAALLIVVGCAQGDRDDARQVVQAGATTGARQTGASRQASTGSLERWESFDFTKNLVYPPEAALLPLVELQRIRAVIFGRHGRVFEDNTIQGWLATRPWYHADTAFKNAALSHIERENLDVIREAEAAKHTQIEPGDMRFYQDRVITTAMLGTHSGMDWVALEAEILANHGFVFENNYAEWSGGNGTLQEYFDARYWYERRPEFSAAQLSPIERQNRDTIILASMRQNHQSVHVGMMNLFQSTPLSDSMLVNLGLASLRLLRNEVYARHGRRFHTAWLEERFRQESWYTPRDDYSDAELSATEKANVALITKREEELHQALATQELDASDLRGIQPDDARLLRNEIYARHGRRFRDPRLRRYFEDFAWYKPNDHFRESQLNATERQNAELIAMYEQGKFTEG